MVPIGFLIVLVFPTDTEIVEVQSRSFTTGFTSDINHTLRFVLPVPKLSKTPSFTVLGNRSTTLIFI